MPKLTPEVLSTAIKEIKRTPEQTATFIFIRTEQNVYVKDGRKATPQDVQELLTNFESNEKPVDSGTMIVDTLIDPNILVCGVLVQSSNLPDETERTLTVASIQEIAKMLTDDTNSLTVRGIKY